MLCKAEQQDRLSWLSAMVHNINVWMQHVTKVTRGMSIAMTVFLLSEAMTSAYTVSHGL